MSLPLGVILAGGEGRRMGGGDKCLLPLAGRPILAHAIARLAPQVAGLVLNANGDPARFAGFGLAVIADADPAGQGPLSGVLAGLDHAAGLGLAAIVTAPGDAPFPPRHLVMALRGAAYAQERMAAMAEAPGPDGRMRAHPVFALWPVSARAGIRARLARGEHRVEAALVALGAARVEIRETSGPDPFLNVNTPQDLARAATQARRSAG